MLIDLSGLKQKLKVAALALGGFIASVSNTAIDYYQTQTQHLEEIVEETAEAAKAAQATVNEATDTVNEHIQKGVAQAKEKLKPAKEAVKKAQKKVDSWGCKIGSKKDPRCASPPQKIYPLSQELQDLSRP